jgi:tRNA-dihydrouridine synthase B
MTTRATQNTMIGSHRLSGPVLLAPMCGISDAPFRQQCLAFGASLAATEMTASDTGMWNSRKYRNRLDFHETNGIRVVQIAGSEPEQMATAARAAAERGADIIDINMGCPAKKVCRKLAGSALLKDEELVKRILDAVVESVDIPVSLKIRTGWDPQRRNGVKIAELAEDSGIKALAVHGRTRACAYRGEAEYDTIREIKSTVNIPVFANGDIDTPGKAKRVMESTGADGVMIGRGACGQPWLFDQITKFLSQKVYLPRPSLGTQRDIILAHLDTIHRFYGEHIGVRVAKKHLKWYCQNLVNADDFCFQVIRVDSSIEQMRLTETFFDRILKELETAKDSASGESRPWRRQEKKRFPKKDPTKLLKSLSRM